MRILRESPQVVELVSLRAKIDFILVHTVGLNSRHNSCLIEVETKSLVKIERSSNRLPGRGQIMSLDYIQA